KFRRNPRRALLFRLALALGTTAAELEHRLSARELAEWAAYEAVFGPIGPQRLDALAALISYYVVSALGTGKGGRKPRLQDFLPRWGEYREEVRDGEHQEPPDQARRPSR
ncbi:MAG: hypothetical protein C0P65_012555, partial [Lysobacteraceae bacterium]